MFGERTAGAFMSWLAKFGMFGCFKYQVSRASITKNSEPQ